MKKFSFTKRHRTLLIGSAIALAAAGLYCLLARFGIGFPCLFYRFTGYQCPGCGNTRAALALLRLDFGAAFRLNPLCFAEFLYIGWILLHCARSYLKGNAFSYKPPFLWLDILLLVVILIWWPLRNFL